MIESEHEVAGAMRTLYDQLDQRFSDADRLESHKQQRAGEPLDQENSSSNAVLGSKLLHDAASYFEILAEQDPSQNEHLEETARLYRAVARQLESNPEGQPGRDHRRADQESLPSHAAFAAKLLREAAEFFQELGTSNPELKDHMERKVEIFQCVADRVESQPNGTLEED